MYILLGIYGVMSLITGIIVCVLCYRDSVVRNRILKMYNECIEENGYSTKKASFTVAASIIFGVLAMATFWPLFWIICIIAYLI